VTRWIEEEVRAKTQIKEPSKGIQVFVQLQHRCIYR